MKKIIRVFSLVVAPLIYVCAFLTGCKRGTDVSASTGEIMQDMDAVPDLEVGYEKYSRQAIADYKAVANMHLIDDEVDIENPEVIEAAKIAAAKLYAYACYNERTLDRYAWFNDQKGFTKLDVGSADITKQDYFMRINETESNKGFRCTYTFKYVNNMTGAVSLAKNAFEAARLRVDTDTDILNRFQGDNMRIGKHHEALNCDLIESDWSTVDNEWNFPVKDGDGNVKSGYEDDYIVKAPFIEPEDIEADIIAQADRYSEKGGAVNIRGCINILAENIVKHAVISEDTEGGYFIMMTIDTEVANNDRASVKMLSKLNDTKGDCNWKAIPNGETGLGEDTGLKIFFRLWGNGLFRFYHISERWTGAIDAGVASFSGTAESELSVSFSYSEKDCDPAPWLAMVDEANRLKAE